MGSVCMACTSRNSQKSSERSTNSSLATETGRGEGLVLYPFYNTEPALHLGCEWECCYLLRGNLAQLQLSGFFCIPIVICYDNLYGLEGGLKTDSFPTYGCSIQNEHSTSLDAKWWLCHLSYFPRGSSKDQKLQPWSYYAYLCHVMV